MRREHMPGQKKKASRKDHGKGSEKSTAHSLLNTLRGSRLQAVAVISKKHLCRPKSLPRHDFCAPHHAWLLVAQARRRW
jgi:hypothetical protein